jgi:hypothetical protein
MKLEDESLLTAYLDGELDPDQRLPIEAALRVDPELAEQVRRLAAVRDLVAAMPRPALTTDLVGAIGARLARLPVPTGNPSRSSRQRRLRQLAAPAGVGLAATLLITAGLALRTPPPVRPPEHVDPAVRIASAPRQTLPTEPGRLADPEVPTSRAHGPKLAAAPVEKAERPVEEEASTEQSRDAERIRQMLDNPQLRRILIVTDQIGGTARDRVEELVRKTPRTESAFGRITVAQGIVIDPLHPNEATVFALVMNEQELRHFRRKLQQSFPEHVEETGADPAVVTHLADIGQVSVLPGSTAAAVVIPAEDSSRVALKTTLGLSDPLTEKLSVDPRPGPHATGGFAPGLESDPGEANRTSAADRSVIAPSRTSGASPPPLLSRKGESSIDDAGPADRKKADELPLAGLLSDALLKDTDRHEPPGIVLVWVTSP